MTGFDPRTSGYCSTNWATINAPNVQCFWCTVPSFDTLLISIFDKFFSSKHILGEENSLLNSVTRFGDISPLLTIWSHWNISCFMHRTEQCYKNNFVQDIFSSFKLAIPGHFYRLFKVFSNKQYNFTTTYVKKCPSSIWIRDSNPWLLGRESPPMTTRPGLPPSAESSFF